MWKSLLGGVVLAAAVTIAAAQHAEEPKPLRIGDQAPALTDVVWIKGEAIPSWKQGEVYVLDFWATWCGPCIRAIPHMNEIELKHKKNGVNVIGVAIWPRPNMTSPAQFVADQGAGMSYRIAEDVEGKSAATFMQAAGQGGIPTVMIVDRAGKLAWIGQPTPAMDEALQKVMAGTFDLSAAVADSRQAESQRIGRQLSRKFAQAAKEKRFEDAVSIADLMLETDPKEFARAAFLKYRLLAADLKDKSAAASWGRTAVGTHLKSDMILLNEMAWYIVSNDRVADADRDADLALIAAQRANELSDNSVPAYLDTLAHAHFLKGDAAKAVEFQTRAVELEPDPEMKKEFTKGLEKFRSAAPKG